MFAVLLLFTTDTIALLHVLKPSSAHACECFYKKIPLWNLLSVHFRFHFVLKRCWVQVGVGGGKVCTVICLCKQLHVMQLLIVYSLQNLMEIFNVLLKIHCIKVWNLWEDQKILETLRLRFFAFPANRERQEVTWSGPCRQVCGLRFTFVRLDHAPEVLDWPQGFWHPKTSQSYVWEEIRFFRIFLLIYYQLLFF